MRRFLIRRSASPIAIQSLRLPHGAVDSLVLLFESAKLSIVGVNDQFELVTISIHSFEHLYSIQDVPCLPASYQPPKLAVDPDHRCIALLLFDNTVAIVPLSSDDYVLPSYNSYGLIGRRYSFPSFHFSLQSTCATCREIQFLPNLIQPCFVVTHEVIPRFPGEIAPEEPDELFSITAINVICSTQEFIPIWSQKGLPNTITNLCPCVLGGVIGTTLDGLVYVSDVTVQKIPLDGEETVRLGVMASLGSVFLPNVACLCTSDGKLFLIDSDLSVQPLLAIDRRPVPPVVFPNRLSINSDGMMFISSTHSDCPLLSISVDTSEETEMGHVTSVDFERLSHIPTRGGAIQHFSLINERLPWFAICCSGFADFGNFSLLSKYVLHDHLNLKKYELVMKNVDYSYHIRLNQSDLIVVTSRVNNETSVLKLDKDNITEEKTPLLNPNFSVFCSMTSFQSVVQVCTDEIRLISPNLKIETINFSQTIISACLVDTFLCVTTKHDVSIFSITTTGLFLIGSYHDNSTSPIVSLTGVPPQFFGVPPLPAHTILISFLRQNGSGVILSYCNQSSPPFGIIFQYSNNLLSNKSIFNSFDSVKESPIISTFLFSGPKSSTYFVVLCSTLVFKLFKLHYSSNSQTFFLEHIPFNLNHCTSPDLSSLPITGNHFPQITPFDDLMGSYSGVFIPQPPPLLPVIILTSSSNPFYPLPRPRAFPIKLSNSFVTGFKPLSFLNSHSFCFFSEESLSLTSFPTGSLFNQELFSRTLPLTKTPNKVAFLPESNTFAIAVELVDGHHEIHLIDGETLSLLDRYPFKPDEAILSMVVGDLRLGPATGDVDEGPIPPPRPRKQHLCIGTGFIKGEWHWVRGRIVLLRAETAEQIQQQGKQQGSFGSRISLVTVWDKEETGHVAALDIMEPGYLISMAGARLFVQYLLQNGRLKSIGFFDCRYYVTDLSAIKSFVFFGDIDDSCQLVQWRDSSRSVEARSHDSFFFSF
ncbi:hypothetical protein GEMRC1_008678 [Eukaryota sp. GEM-RC1]